MCNLKDIKFTVDFINKIDKNYLKKKKLAILHCNTSYPTPLNDSNLGTIKFLEDKFNLDIGYSDHTMGDEVLVYSYLSGAKIIAKRDIKKNEKFSDKNIICLRPFLNNSSLMYFKLIKKKSKKNYKKGDLI